MKRKAILIESSNVAGQNDLPGARVDVENWQSFLTSPLGGEWTSDEIVVLRKPYSSDVERQLQLASDGYCFVAFSGHGEDGSVALNESYLSYPISSLRPRGSRGAMVIDACRGVSTATYNFANLAESLANASTGRTLVLKNSARCNSTDFTEVRAFSARAYNTFASSRATWESGFTSLTGIVEMFACARGQGADEDPNAGGYYTSLLLASAEAWKNTGGVAKIHTTLDAHNYAAKMLPRQQTPEYKPTWLAYPFAVRA